MRVRSPLAVACLAALWFCAPAAGEWMNSVRQDFVAEQNRPHPRKRSLILRVPVDAPHGAELCWTYANGRNDQADKGALKIRAQVTRQESPSGPIRRVDRINFGKVRVRSNGAGDCGGVVPLRAGDIAVFSFRFLGVPRLRVDSENELEAMFQFSGSVNFRE